MDTHLGGDDPVVWVPLGDVGLSARRGLPVAHVDRPAVHPVLLPGTLRVGNRAVSVGGAWGQGLPRVGFHAGLCGGQRGAAGPTCKVDPYSPPPPLPHPFRNLCFPPPPPSSSRKSHLHPHWAQLSVEMTQRAHLNINSDSKALRLPKRNDSERS